jgi:hypothetical protein
LTNEAEISLVEKEIHQQEEKQYLLKFTDHIYIDDEANSKERLQI